MRHAVHLLPTYYWTDMLRRDDGLTYLLQHQCDTVLASACPAFAKNLLQLLFRFSPDYTPPKRARADFKPGTADVP